MADNPGNQETSRNCAREGVGSRDAGQPYKPRTRPASIKSRLKRRASAPSLQA